MREKLAFVLALISMLMLIAQSYASEEDSLCNESTYQSWNSNKNHPEFSSPTQIPITVALYVHEGGVNGPLLSGVTIMSKDGAGTSFDSITQNGYLDLAGQSGIWQFTISKENYKTKSVSTYISASGRLDYFLENSQDTGGYAVDAQQTEPQFTSLGTSQIDSQPAQLGSSTNYQSSGVGSEGESGDSALSPPAYSQETSSASPYAVDFDLRDMKGFNGNIISADDIEAFILERTPNSPMLSEADIGSCFINAGLKNNVNPAFLVAIAYLESGFGILGWAKEHLECHNSFGYAIYLGDELPNQDNCADSWCMMLDRVAFAIANSNGYYDQGLFTITQVGTRYPGNLDPNNIANLMNELYSFSLSRKDGYTAQPVSQPDSQDAPQSTEETLEAVSLSGYKPSFIPKTSSKPTYTPKASQSTGETSDAVSLSGYKPTYIPKVASTSPEPVQLGGPGVK